MGMVVRKGRRRRMGRRWTRARMLCKRGERVCLYSASTEGYSALCNLSPSLSQKEKSDIRSVSHEYLIW